MVRAAAATAGFLLLAAESALGFTGHSRVLQRVVSQQQQQRRQRSASASVSMNTNFGEDAEPLVTGTALVSGFLEAKERTDQFVFDLLHKHGAFTKIIAYNSDTSFAKKRLISRSARYSGLGNVLPLEGERRAIPRHLGVPGTARCEREPRRGRCRRTRRSSRSRLARRAASPRSDRPARIADRALGTLAERMRQGGPECDRGSDYHLSLIHI